MGDSICFATRPSLVTRHGREFRTPISIQLWRYVTERYGSVPVTPLTFCENRTASPPFSIKKWRAKGLGQCWKTTVACFGLEWIWPSCGFRMAVFEKSRRLVGSVSRASAGCQVLPKIRAERYGFLPPAASYSAWLGTKLRSKARSITNSAGSNIWWRTQTAVFGAGLQRV